MNFKKNGGFTLVELIVVIAILGLLAGIGIPTYSGYVEKSQEVVDNQNLTMLNNLFLVVCAELGADPADVTIVDIDFENNTFKGLLSVNGVEVNVSMFHQRRGGGSIDGNALFVERFNALKGADITFKKKTEADIIDGIENGVEGAETRAAYKQVLDKLLGAENTDNLNKLMASVWGDLGAKDLTDKVDWTADIADAMLSMNPNGKFADMITNCADAMMGFMGITDPDAQGAKMQELAIAKMEQMIKADPEKYGGMDAKTVLQNYLGGNGTPAEKELVNSAQNSIAINNAILAAAKNSSTASSNIKNTLNSENPKTALINSVNSGMANKDTSAAMGEVALAYAMYMSYAERNNIKVEDVDDVLEGLNSSGFKAYVNNEDASETDDFQTDMDGYLASMNMINNSVQGNEDAVTDVVLNGFGNSNLNDILQQAMDSTKKSN